MSKYIIAEVWDLGAIARLTPQMLKGYVEKRGWTKCDERSTIFNTEVFYRESEQCDLKLELSNAFHHKQKDLAAIAEAEGISQLDILVDLLGPSALFKNPAEVEDACPKCCCYRPSVDEVEADLAGVAE